MAARIVSRRGAEIAHTVAVIVDSVIARTEPHLGAIARIGTVGVGRKISESVAIIVRAVVARRKPPFGAVIGPTALEVCGPIDEPITIVVDPIAALWVRLISITRARTPRIRGKIDEPVTIVVEAIGASCDMSHITGRARK
jgi:hypothetical protein